MPLPRRTRSERKVRYNRPIPCAFIPSKDISVPPRRINEIVHGKRAVTADTALRLSRYLGTTDRFWLNLQTCYELEVRVLNER
jgi:hypothetical protein